VEGRRGQAVSERAGPVAVTMVDTFAPAAPVKFAALAGPRSVELSWDRNMEPDLKGYRVRRASGDGEFVVLADFVETPAYSDRAVESGVRYRYAVTALDLRNNESKQSEIVEITLP
jgi:fibronectin type 3 domain-containing protein